MKSTRLLSPLRQATPLLARRSHRHVPPAVISNDQLQFQIQRRRFLSNPLSETQTLSATRTLPYPASAVYSIIADISSYSQFLPYCLSSRVVKTSRPDSNTGREWPQEAVMEVGWGDVKETFHSKIYCVPERIVEAVGGQSLTTLRKEEIAHHEPDAAAPGRDVDPSATRILTHLLTRWTLRPFPYKPPPTDTQNPQEGKAALPAREQTEVSLSIEFQFANPAYAFMSMAVAPKVAGTMVGAFEKRIAELMDGPSVKAREGQLDGVLGGK